jgi:DUF4097 and DUF4098 domain-containing protein YvlB
MARGWFARIASGGVLAATLFVCSSCVYVHTDGSARCERETELSAPLAAGSSLRADTGDGSISVEGTQTPECKVRAKVVAHARTEEQAQELAEQIDVRLEPSGEGLAVVTKRPALIRNAWYSVSLTAQVPTQTSLGLATGDGSIRIANITGNVDAKSSDGGVEVEGLKGDVKLRTADGSITGSRIEAGTLDVHTNDGGIKLTDVTGQSCRTETSDGSIALTNVRADDLTARTNDGGIRAQNITATRAEYHTSDGSLHIEYAPDAPKALNATATTSSGGITFVAPPGLSAVVEAITGDGSINTDLPITVQGKIGKTMNGTIGGGEGRVYLKTSDGSITIR